MAIDPIDFENRPFLNALAKKQRKAFVALTIEHIIQGIWRLFFWVLFICGLWMLGIPSFFGQAANILTTLIFVIGCIYFLKKDALLFKFPHDKTLNLQLEKQSALPRGQIALLEDKLANPRKHETRDLWNLSQKTALHTMAHLKTPSIRTFLSRRDPYAYRFIALIMFIAGLMVSGNAWQDRISAGLMPISPSFAISQGKDTQIWIKPPEYTLQPEIYISGHGTYAQTIDIPEESEIKLRLYSSFGKLFTPYLKIGQDSHIIPNLENGLYGIETTITDATSLSVTQLGISRAKINYNYINDTPPEIYTSHNEQDSTNSQSFDGVEDIIVETEIPTENTDTTQEQDTTEPTTTEEDLEPEEQYEQLSDFRLRFPLAVKDDYSVTELHMKMDIDEMVEDKPLGGSFTDIRLIMSRPNTEFKISPTYDLAWHTWAGLPVTFEFTAHDHKKQTSSLQKISLVLPERHFEHPMAKTIIALRKRLAWDYNDSFIEVAQNLEVLLSAPDYFQNNPIIFLGLRTASSRLYYVDKKPQEDRITAAEDIIDLLWNLAISIEDGNLALAMRELRDAQRALENAMRDPNSSDEEIAQLMDNLRQKMMEYFVEMQRDAQKRMQDGDDFPQFSPDQFSELISPDSLAKLMEEIENAMKSGDEEKARELMSQLQRMMEMMGNAGQMQMPKDMQMMKKGINELQQLIEKQEALLEKTNKQANLQKLLNKHQKQRKKNAPSSMPTMDEILKDFGMNNAPPTPKQENNTPTPPPTDQKNTEQNAPMNIDTSENRAEQQALRYILGQLMLEASEKLDEIPENMGNAEQEMRGSEEALAQVDPKSAIPHQEKAIEHLKEAQEQLSQQLKARLQQMIGIGFSGAQRYDPLGRPYGGDQDENGSAHGSPVKIPDEQEKKRVDEILRTLRDRSGDRSRPQDELDYYRRLLRQF